MLGGKFNCVWSCASLRKIVMSDATRTKYVLLHMLKLRSEKQCPYYLNTSSSVVGSLVVFLGGRYLLGGIVG